MNEINTNNSKGSFLTFRLTNTTVEDTNSIIPLENVAYMHYNQFWT